MIKNIIFDCWSTLVKFKPKIESWTYNPLIVHLLNKDEVDTTKLKDFISSFLDEYYKTDIKYEIDNKQFYQLLIDMFNLKEDASVDLLKEETLDNLEIECENHVNDFLNLLSKNKINMAVASNTMYSLEKTKEIIHSCINYNFDDVITSSMYGVRKPHQCFFDAVLNRLHYKKEETIYIGDSPIEDGYGPYNAGFKGSMLVLNSKKDINLIPDKKIFDDSNFIFKIYQNYDEVIADFNNIKEYFY